MKKSELKHWYVDAVKIAFRTITPWKKRKYESDSQAWSEQRYVDGWNDCIKEIKKNRREWLKKIGKL